MLKLIINEVEYEVRQWRFPGGEIGVKVPQFHEIVTSGDEHYSADIVLVYENNDELFALAQLSDIVDRICLSTSATYSKRLYLPYIPYSPQDRVTAPGEAASLKLLAGMINSMKFDRVISVDPHSYVSENLIDKLHIVKQHEVARGVLESDNNTIQYDYIIAPDAGAEKKVYEYYSLYQPQAKFVVCSKRRDEKGNIVGYTTHHDFKGVTNATALVLDDICWGGATFINLAKAVDEAGGENVVLDLYVSHGFFTKGFSDLLKYYNRIYTPQLFSDRDNIPEEFADKVFCEHHIPSKQ